jgi:hypothetical protein
MHLGSRLIVSTLLVATLLLACYPSASAQKRKATKQLTADMLDEFGALGYCDLTARLDNFAIVLQDTQKATGHILSYAPPNRGQDISEQLKNYLVNSRGIDPDSIITTYAGRNDVLSSLRVQLWIVPNGAVPPVPKKFDAKPESFKGMFYEHPGYDEIAFPGVAEEGEGFSLGVTLDAFTDVFKQQPKSVAYVVGYNGDTSSPGAWRRIAEDEVSFLKRGGFEPSRFKTVYGGNVKEAKVQVWIQSASDQTPVQEAGPESAPAISIQMGDYGEGPLSYQEYERAAFKRISDSLRQFPNLKACVIVRVEQPPEGQETEEPANLPAQMNADGPIEPEEPTPPLPDLFQLAEKWKQELSDKYQLREDRFVVLFSKGLPGYGASLETWLVPQGQALPDPETLLKEAKPDVATEQATNPVPQLVNKTAQPVTNSQSPDKSSDTEATRGKKP